MSNGKVFLKGFIFLNLLALLLIGVNYIPRSVVTKNIKESIKYYGECYSRTERIKGVPQSTDDIITDTIILNLIYNVDSKNVIKSTISADYYLDDYAYYNQQLERTVFEGKEANTSYSRYWHGYNIIIRPLLIFFNVKEMKVFLLGIYLALLVILIYISAKKDMLRFSVLFLVSSVIGTLYFEFFTLGHLAPLFVSIIGCLLIIWKERLDVRMLFAFLGIAVSFFDFLSTEVITLTLPLICLLMKERKHKRSITLKEFIILCTNWLLGYSLTYVYKWALVVVFCGKESLITVYGKGVEKFISKDFLAGLSLNIQMLFPGIKSNIAGLSIFAVLITSIAIVVYLFHKQGCNKGGIVGYLAFIFIIPYIRYLVLSNHGFVHYFFTYRCQVTSIMALLLIVGISLDWRLVKKCLLGR